MKVYIKLEKTPRIPNQLNEARLANTSEAFSEKYESTSIASEKSIQLPAWLWHNWQSLPSHPAAGISMNTTDLCLYVDVLST